MCCGALDVSDLHQQLRSLDVGLHVSVKNLRSQVVREACITIALVPYFNFVTELFINLLTMSSYVPVYVLPNSPDFSSVDCLDQVCQLQIA